MCSRYALIAAADRLQQRFDKEVMDQLVFKPEIRIGDMGPVVTREGIRLGRFGLKSHDQKAVFNARSETWEQKQLFQHLEPCLVPATSFNEWSSSKEKFDFGSDDGELLVFPGLMQNGAFVILTCEPDAVVKPIHDRMPVCLAHADEDRWLDRILPSTRARVRIIQDQSTLFG